MSSKELAKKKSEILTNKITMKWIVSRSDANADQNFTPYYTPLGRLIFLKIPNTHTWSTALCVTSGQAQFPVKTGEDDFNVPKKKRRYCICNTNISFVWRNTYTKCLFGRKYWGRKQSPY